MKPIHFRSSISSNKIWLLVLWLISVNQEINSSKHEWLNNLVNYLKNESQVHQVLFLIDETKKADLKEDIILETSRSFPTLELSFKEATTKKALELSLLPPFRYPQRTTLIITIYELSNKTFTPKLVLPLDFMSNLSESKMRPKSLFIFLQQKESSNCEQLLRYMWSELFLDVTVFELVTMPSGRENHKTIHHLNPFNDTIVKEDYSSRISWFPDKTRNLNGHQMKIGLFNSPPFALVKYNLINEIVDARGSDVQMMKALGQAMNFKPKWISSKYDHWGFPNCNKNNSTGLLGDVMQNKIQLIGTLSGLSGGCTLDFVEIVKGTRPIRVIIVVPNLRQKSATTVEWRISNVMAPFGLITFMWILSRLLQFTKRPWRYFDIFQVVFGWPIDQNPEKLAERIVFGSILCACLLYTSLIYTAFTDVTLKMESEIELSTINDVLSSSLVPAISPYIHFMLYRHSEGNLQLLLNRSTLWNDSGLEACVKILVERKNVACIGREENAKFAIRNERDICDTPTVKIVKEPLLVTQSAFMMESRSPYVRRFDNLILRITEAGIYGLWRKSYFHGRTGDDKSCTSGREELEATRSILLIWVLLIGNALSFVVFICEILIAFLIRKYNHRNLQDTITRTFVPSQLDEFQQVKETPSIVFSKNLNPSSQQLLHRRWIKEINRFNKEKREN